MSRKPLIIAHRGFSGRFPENTIRAVKEALRLGVDGVEVDARMTKDGVVVLMHDETVDRTTNGHGKVKELTWGEIMRLDAGSWKGEEFSCEPVPRLEEVLSETVGRAVLHIEVKEVGVERAVLRLVQEYDALNWVVIDSFYPEVIKNAYLVEPRVGRILTLGWLEDNDEAGGDLPIQKVFSCAANGLSLYMGHATEKTIGHAHRRLLSVSVWTVNNVGDALRLAELGADALVTDYPDVLLNYLRNENKQ
ncbi:MAG: glycerophosphodiester phosphodiesterase family protein [Nitrososphaerota archaeon]|nr:hypothetical protein [Candidatus Calditenuaceae archaeon]MDW8073032.1 glycerophosphodiester phosphodiesterase family protein [Nitrososphaerota archaeon]